MRPALIAVSTSLLVLPLSALTQQDSDLVRAAKAAAAVTRHSRMPVITNDTLAHSGGHMATAEGEATPAGTTASTTTPAAGAKTPADSNRSATYAPGGANVSVGAAHLTQPPAPAYSPGSMAPSRPAMVSTQAVPTSASAPTLGYTDSYRPSSAGTRDTPAMVSTTTLPTAAVTKPPQ